MRPEYESYTVIDDYLGGKLPREKELEFEEMIRENTDLKEEVFFRKIMNEAVIEGRYFEMASSFRHIPITPGMTGSSSVWMKKIAGLSMIAGAGIASLFYFNQQSPSGEKVKVVSEKSADTSSQLLPETTVSGANIAATDSSGTDTKTIDDKKSEKEVKKLPKKEKKDRTFLVEIPIDDPSGNVHSASGSYTIHPDKGEYWSIPLNGRKTAGIRIFNKTGKVVYTSSIVNGQPDKWSGISSDGIALEANQYTYLLDFGGGTIEHGRITIKRSGK